MYVQNEVYIYYSFHFIFIVEFYAFMVKRLGALHDS